MADAPFDVTARRFRFGLLLLAIFAIGPVAVYANNGTVPILAVACLALLHPRQAWRDLHRMLLSPCGLALIALVVWSLISTAWAPGGADSFLRVVKVTSIMGAGVLLIVGLGQIGAGERLLVAFAVVGAVGSIVVLVAIEFAIGGSPAVDLKAAQSSRFIYLSDLLGTAAPVAAVLIWPAIAILRSRRQQWLGPFVGVAGVAVVLALLPLASAVLALALGGFTFVLAMRRTSALAAIGIAFAGYVLVAPFVSAYAINLDTIGTVGRGLPTSWQHRLEIWRFTARTALDRPLFGHGFDASREIGRAPNPVRIWNPDGSGRNYLDKGLPLHPHNAALQIWLELGLVGVVVLLSGVFAVLAWIRRTGPAMARATAAAALTSFLVIELLAYGVWQSWWHAAAWLMGGAVLVAMRLSAPERPPAEQAG